MEIEKGGRCQFHFTSFFSSLLKKEKEERLDPLMHMKILSQRTSKRKLQDIEKNHSARNWKCSCMKMWSKSCVLLANKKTKQKKEDEEEKDGKYMQAKKWGSSLLVA